MGCLIVAIAFIVILTIAALIGATRSDTDPDATDAASATARVEGGAALRTAATSAASLLVLRPLLKDDEFTEAWPMTIIDPRSLPHHVYVPPIGAVG